MTRPFTAAGRGSATAAGGPISLLDRVLALDALKAAWLRVHANAGKPGGDGVSLRRFERLLEANLLALADEVRTGAYCPGRLRRVHVHDGGKLRALAIPGVRDRVLQRAVLEALVPRCDPAFLSCSFGYRPGRSREAALARIVRLRERGFVWVVDADIRDCFGSLDHALLRQFVATFVPDAGLRQLLDLWITAAADGREDDAPGRGIPLGAVVSPLLCNIYLHQLDLSLRRRRYQMVRYADDFVVLCKSWERAERGQRSVSRVLRGLKLELNPLKTRVVDFATGFDFLGVHFEGRAVRFEHDGKRVVADHLPPEWFDFFPDGYA